MDISHLGIFDKYHLDDISHLIPSHIEINFPEIAIDNTEDDKSNRV